MTIKVWFYFWILIFGFLFGGCTTEQEFIYQAPSGKYSVTIEESEKNEYRKDTLMTFKNIDKSKILRIGFIKDGFVNGLWNYNKPNTNTIKWGYYKNEDLFLEMSLFENADSTYYGNNYLTCIFKKSNRRIVLSIYINSYSKAYLENNSYKKILYNDFESNGVKVSNFKTFTLQHLKSRIFIHSFIANRSNFNYKYYKLANGFIGDDFIEVTVKSDFKDDFLSFILFDTVVTNLKYKGKYFFKPVYY